MIALLSSLRDEAENYLARTEVDSVKSKTGFNFHIGAIDETPVTIVTGKNDHLDTAWATRILLENFDIERIILTGTAASLVPYLQQGDIIGAERLVQYNPAWGDTVSAAADGTLKAEILRSDFDMIKMLGASYEAVFGGKSNRPQYLTGTMVSGKVDADNRGVISILQKEFAAITTDLDSAAVAAICTGGNLPLAVVKTVVDEGVDLAEPLPDGIGADVFTLIRHYLAECAQPAQLII